MLFSNNICPSSLSRRNTQIGHISTKPGFSGWLTERGADGTTEEPSSFLLDVFRFLGCSSLITRLSRSIRNFFLPIVAQVQKFFLPTCPVKKLYPEVV
jgi:hypothetical protein